MQTPNLFIGSVIELSALEPRRLCSAAYPTNVEQYEVELVNRARANPSAEAQRQGIDLNEGLAAGTISTAAKQPLAINPYLTASARGHADWMIDNNVFSHTGAGGSDPGDRMRSAGYSFTGNWTWGENIGYRSSYPNTPEPVSTTAQIHNDLFVDNGIAGRGHRTNMMSNAYKEIGAGLSAGEFNNFNALMLANDFATSGSGSFLTGVAYADTTTHDSFYTPGEGMAGVTVTATRAGDNAVFSTTTWSSGGYSLKLNSGTYIIKASGGSLGGDVTYSNVVIGAENVKKDFTPADAVPPTPPTTPPSASGTAAIRGTVFNDFNRDGQLESGETGIPGVLVYIERNHDNRRNHDELYARTNADGAYKISGLAAGTYRVQQTIVSGESVTAPAMNTYVVKVKAGQTVGGRSFGNVTTASASQPSIAVSKMMWNNEEGSLASKLFDAIDAL